MRCCGGKGGGGPVGIPVKSPAILTICAREERLPSGEYGSFVLIVVIMESFVGWLCGEEDGEE